MKSTMKTIARRFTNFILFGGSFFVLEIYASKIYKEGAQPVLFELLGVGLAVGMCINGLRLVFALGKAWHEHQG